MAGTRDAQRAESTRQLPGPTRIRCLRKAFRASLTDELLHGSYDMGRVNPGGMEQFVGFAGAGHLVHGELRHLGQRASDGLLVGARERFEHGITEAALDPVVLDRAYLAVGSLGGGK